jgi:hypothetical protein
MSGRDKNKEISEKRNAISLIDLLMNNEVSVKGNVISKKEKELINNVIVKIYDMDWGQEDVRIKMMFDMSLIIDKIKKL